MLTFLTESSKDFQETDTIGSFKMGRQKNDFDQMYENAYNTLMSENINPMVDITLMVKNPAVMEAYKDELLSQLRSDCDRYDAIADSSRYTSLYEQTSALFDNCVDDLVTESTRVGQLLPIKAIDFPVLIKQNLAIASKDIIQTEVTKSPVIKKHIERRWVVDEKSGKRWEYPQCFFKDDYKEIFKAGKGYPIKNTPVDITAGNCFNYSIPENLADGVTGDQAKDQKITFDLKIVSANVDFSEGADGSDLKDVPLQMRINMSDNTWLGGQIKNDKGEIIDVITGTVDFINNTVSLSSAAGRVKSVVFDGFLSNEFNERTVTFDRTRENMNGRLKMVSVLMFLILLKNLKMLRLLWIWIFIS